MNILEVLQTIGICVGGLALAVIAFMVFMALSPFISSLPSTDDNDDDINVLWTTPNSPPRSRRRQRRSKSKDAPGDESQSE